MDRSLAFWIINGVLFTTWLTLLICLLIVLGFIAFTVINILKRRRQTTRAMSASKQAAYKAFTEALEQGTRPRYASEALNAFWEGGLSDAYIRDGIFDLEVEANNQFFNMKGRPDDTPDDMDSQN